ncbi:hypothetical protein B0H19DRAFT_1272536 [Mycena capillaripes]|nr:hypothetical protein B0H19DRAFT_1272470 [Mycena capillaripes]KAJ6533137.1 hypothetical protein B0H19DRAFT_1272536 [Mycena capillaripes]
MKFTTAFPPLIPFVTALPPALRSTVEVTNSTKITARTQGNVFVCTAGGFAGTCGKFHGASGQCVDFLSQFNDEISAIGPDSGQDCFFYL